MMAAPLTFARQLPEPGRGWIACAPRLWRACDRPWVDLATGRLAPAQVPPAPLPATAGWPRDIDELTYLPPVAIGLRSARDALAASAAEAGIPCLVQVLPGEEAPAAALVVVDLTGPLLGDELERVAAAPAGGHALWPLVPGITDGQRTIEDGLARLAAAGVATVCGIAVEIAPALRQRLAEGRPSEVFEALFRVAAASEEDFAGRAAGHGLGLWPERPPTGGTPRVVGNRRIAAALAEAAELWQRLDRSEAAGQALWRAARRAEQSDRDLVALGREGNLGVLEWLDPRALDLARAAAGGEPHVLLRDLRAAYVGAS